MQALFLNTTVNKLKAYDIGFSGLSEGIHLFEYQINDDFLKLLPSEELETVELIVKLNLEKQSRMLILSFELEGRVSVLCDRCLDPLHFPLKGQEQLIVKFGNEEMEESDEIIIIPETEHKINVAQFIYEYIHLMLPLKRVHGEDAGGQSLCDPDMLKRISNEEHSNSGPSPWDVLRNLNDDIKS